MPQELLIKLVESYSGNKTLNLLMRDGFTLPHDNVCGLVILLRGKPGAGKSTLALQVLEALPANTLRYYCSLEQTVEDLQFKRISMLVAQAVLAAWEPDYKRASDDRKLACNKITFWNTLRAGAVIGKTAVKKLQKKIERLLGQMTIPLYDGPSGKAIMLPKQVLDIAEAILDWQRVNRSALTTNSHANQGIRFRGLETQAEAASQQGPLGSGKSRSLAAFRMLENIVAELEKRTDINLTNRSCRPFVVIDGLSLLTNSEREMLELQRIVDRLRQLSQIGILVYEPSADESTSLDHHADMVIELCSKTIEKPMAYLIHEMCIRKARYQETALGEHQFKIRRSGLVFFPSVHFQVQHPSYMDFELTRSTAKDYKPGLTVIEEPSDGINPVSSKSPPPTPIGSIIDMIFAPEAGESVVLLGSRGSFKTELCLDYLSHGGTGCPKGKPMDKLEQGLLISLISSSPNIERGVPCPWHRARFDRHVMERHQRCRDCKHFVMQHVRPFKQPPGCISSAELLYYFLETIERLKAGNGLSRLVFWDLTQLDYRFPLLKPDAMLLPAMMDIFRRTELKCLFMGAENATNTPAASAMADNVVFCWRSDVTKPEEQGEWKHEADLMLYVDRASQRPGKPVYRIPIYNSKEHECLRAPQTAAELDSAEYCIDWKSLGPEDKDHVKKIRKFQGLE